MNIISRIISRTLAPSYLRTFALTALFVAALNVQAQTMNIHQGNVTYAIPAADAGQMPFGNSMTLTVGEREYTLGDITSITIDETEVTPNTVSVDYNGSSAHVTIAGNIAPYVDATVKGAHVALVQAADYAGDEITYILSGQSDNGSLWMDGKLKASFVLNGLTLHNPDSAAINIRDGKRISLELADGTTNTLSDGEGGSWKACLMVKGHTELKGAGTLTIEGNTGHAFWGKEYVEVKKTFGTLNITKAVGDGFNVNQYFEMKGGKITISGVGDDGIQLSYDTDDDGNIVVEDENTGEVKLSGGSLNITTTGAGAKGIKAEGSFLMQGGELSVNQTGAVDTSGSDLDYCAAVRAKENITIQGGTLNVSSTANGGRGLNADGMITIDETVATTIIDIAANGNGGTAEAQGTGEGGDDTDKSYKVYVNMPTTGGGYGGGQAWTKLYLYKEDGTLVQQLTNTVTKTSGYSSLTFYYYDFGQADSGTYYFASDNYESRREGTVGIQSTTFSGPTSGEDVYYSISNSYQTTNGTRVYQLSNVTSQYGGTTEVSEDSGTSYNASGIKADGNITISAGTVTVKNSGAMSKSIKSKATTTISGGTVTLTPSGTMQVINNDASYSSGVKTVDFVMNGGTLTITPSGVAGKGISATNITTNGGTITINNSGTYKAAGTNDAYTAKGMKADGNMALNAGDITIKMTGTGGKGIKVNGAYTQGTSDGNGPTLSVTTTGSSVGTESGGGWGGGMGGKTNYYGTPKAIKVMGAVTLYGGETEVYTSQGGAEGLESKTSITIQGGKHYLKCQDDCMNSSGPIAFNGGTTVCWSTGNDAVDSNYGRSGAITIGNGNIFAYTSAGGAEEGLDCDANSYMQITGNGIAISAGGSQGGGGGWGGGSGNTISNASQGYCFYTSSTSYAANSYFTLRDASGNNLATFRFEQQCSSSLSLFTANGMKKGSTYYVYTGSTEPTDAETAWHGFYIGSSEKGTSQKLSFTAN